jgi:hypothetical protein
MAELSYAQVSALLKYDSETGKLFWKERPGHLFFDTPHGPTACAKAARWNGRYAGKEAFTAKTADGYALGRIFDVAYYAQHVCWLLFYKVWPPHMVGHENDIRSDNRISNLIPVTTAEVSRGRSRRSDNSSGVVGVGSYKATDKWQAYINADGKRVHLGHFAELQDAAAVRVEAEREHGYRHRS